MIISILLLEDLYLILPIISYHWQELTAIRLECLAANIEEQFVVTEKIVEIDIIWQTFGAKFKSFPANLWPNVSLVFSAGFPY